MTTTTLYRTTEVERGIRDSWEVHSYDNLYSSVTEEGWNKLVAEVTNKNQSVLDRTNELWGSNRELVVRTEGTFPNIRVSFNEEEDDDELGFTTSLSLEEIIVDKTL